jgi:hypothetical protein
MTSVTDTAEYNRHCEARRRNVKQETDRNRKPLAAYFRYKRSCVVRLWAGSKVIYEALLRPATQVRSVDDLLL